MLKVNTIRPNTGFKKVLVSATYTVTKPGFSSSAPVFLVWANDESNIVGQIVADGSKQQYTLTPDGRPLDITNKLNYDQFDSATFGISGIIYEVQSFGGVSTKVRVDVSVENTPEEGLTWTTKPPFSSRAFDERYIISNL